MVNRKIKIMKRLIILFFAVAAITSGCAKKIKVTIDGTVPPTKAKLYLIINEDTANAKLLPIINGKFSTTVQVERDAFIRIDDWKDWPKRCEFVLVPDSKHITIDWDKGTITGSPMSQKLQLSCREIRKASPEGFHIDVFSDDPEAWRQAQQEGEAIRASMLQNQKNIAREVLFDNKNSVISVWIAYCFPQIFKGELEGAIEHMNPKWINHPLMQKKR